MKRTVKDIIGYAVLKDKNGFLAWLKDFGWKRKYNGTYCKNWYEGHWSDYFYERQGIFNSATNIFHDVADDRFGQPVTEKFFIMWDYLISIDQVLSCFYYDDFACLVGYGDQAYVMPSEWFTWKALTDYGDLKEQQFRSIGGPVAGGSLPAIAYGVSKNDVKGKLDEKEEELDTLQKECDCIKKGEAKELTDLKQQMEKLQQKMEKKKKELLLELEAKQIELNEKKIELERKLFFLETQIYGIRCYLGEVVKFHKITEGKRADPEEPVIVYQKIRYLDEELGKAISIYGFGDSGSDRAEFLSLLKDREDIRNLFVPDLRCITVLRMSRTGMVKDAAEGVANALKDYKLYHGEQIALLVKNGEEVHITWLDEDKIKLEDENAFYSQRHEKKEREFEEAEVTHSSSKDDIVSRYFLISILQGISDKGIIFNFPERFNILASDQRYLIFSMADGWITDRRFGMFSDILARAQELPLKEGDMVLTALNITRDDCYSTRSTHNETYNNDRGIGNKNRTHDAMIPAFQIVPVNKVLYDLSVEVQFSKVKGLNKSKQRKVNDLVTSTQYWQEDTEEIIGSGAGRINYPFESVKIMKETGKLSTVPTEAELLALSNQNSYTYFYTDVKGRERVFFGYKHDGDVDIYRKQYEKAAVTDKRYHYFLSAQKKGDYWNERNSRANIEIKEDEAIPLTYLCASWVRYAITTGNIGKWRVGGTCLSYADSLKYLNRILEYLKKQQLAELVLLREAGLSQWIESNPAWDVELTEWRMRNQVRKMTTYQAKRFAKVYAHKKL